MSTQMELTLLRTRAPSGISAYSVMQIKQHLKFGYLRIFRQKYPSLNSAVSLLGTRVTQASDIWEARELREAPTREGIRQVGALPVWRGFSMPLAAAAGQLTALFRGRGIW